MAENPGTNPGKGKGELVDGPLGGKLKRGGTNPNAGRPPDEFRAAMRALVNREDVVAYFDRCLKGEFGPKFFLQARQAAKDDGYGRAMQPLETMEFNPSDFSTDGLRRIAGGENPLHVLATGGGVRS